MNDTTDKATQQAAPQQEVRERGETLADFQEGQWWINELDAMASHPIDQTIRVTPDLRRAVAVVHNLLRVVAQQAAPQQAAPAVPLIRQMVAGMETVWACDHIGGICWQVDSSAFDQALAAARAWLNENGVQP